MDTEKKNGDISPPSVDYLNSLPDKYGWQRENEHGYRIKEQLYGTKRPLRVIYVGAGASGICFSKFLQDRMKDVSLVCYDKNEDIGGTWLENRYRSSNPHLFHNSSLLRPMA